MKKIVYLLCLLSLPIIAYAQNGSSLFTATDIYIDMNVTTAAGTTMTAAIAAAGTHAKASSCTWTMSPTTPTGLTVNAANFISAYDVTVNGLGEFLRPIQTKSIALDSSKTFTYMQCALAAGHQRVTFQGYLTLGPPNAGASSALYDLVQASGNISGNLSELQLDNGSGTAGGCYCLNLETTPNGTTTHSALKIPVSPKEQIYYFMIDDYSFNPGSGRLVVYDAITGALLGDTCAIGPCQTTNAAAEDIGLIRYGNNEAGAGVGTFFFDQMTVTYAAVAPTGVGGLPLKALLKSGVAANTAALTEAATAAPAVAELAAHAGALSEAATASPAVLTAAGRSSGLSETATAAPAVLGTVGRKGALAETATATPSLAELAAHLGALSESATAAPALATFAVHGSFLAESVTGSPSVATAAGRSGALSENAAASPFLVTAAGRIKSMTESASLSPAVTLSAGRIGSIAVSITAVDAIAILQGKGALLAASATLVDTLATNSTFGKGMAESVSGSPSVSALAVHVTSLVTTATAVDVIAILKGKGAVLLETTTLADSIGINSSRGKAMSESVSGSPSIGAVAAHLGAIAAAASLSDSIAFATGKGRLMAESAALVDVIARRATLGQQVNASVGVSDSVSILVIPFGTLRRFTIIESH